MKNLHMLSACEAATAIAQGALTSEALVRACLDRIEARDMSVAAWKHLDPAHALAQARDRDATRPAGPLHGIPIGFKDIIDTADMPTTHCSILHEAEQPRWDAACVAMARAAGAVIMGKTITPEFAGRDPGPTSHPLNRNHSPGGSSSGSAAAVADYMVPLAVGTQTAGSVIRPAAYCGIYGYKPTFGILSFAGIHHLAETFDTLGLMARELDDIILFRDALLGVTGSAGEPLAQVPRIAFCRTPYWAEADDATQARLEEAATSLARAGASVDELLLPGEFDDLQMRTWDVVQFEAARNLAPEANSRFESLRPGSRRMIEAGRQIPLERYLGHMRSLERLRRQLDDLSDRFDVILTPSAVGEAPQGLEDTGPVTFNFLWHIMEMPALTVPAFAGPQGLPIGIQLVSKRYCDDTLIRAARWVVRALDLE